MNPTGEGGVAGIRRLARSFGFRFSVGAAREPPALRTRRSRRGVGIPEKGNTEGVCPARSDFPGFFFKPFRRRLLVLLDLDFHRAPGAFEGAFGLFPQVEGFGDFLLNPDLDLFGEDGNYRLFNLFRSRIEGERDTPCRPRQLLKNP